jgi:hypothetical protein
MSNVVEIPSIQNKDQIIYTYEFEIEFYDPENEEVSVKPISIIQVYKECDYISTFNPIYAMTLQFKITDVFILKKNQKNIVASITLKANQYMRLDNGEGSGTKSAELVGTEIISSGSFQPIFSQSAFDEIFREEEYNNKELMASDTQTTVASETDRHTIDVQFEDNIAVKSKKSLFNIVADKDTTVGTILQHIVDILPVKGAIIDIPDNDYLFGQDIIFPPGDLIPFLKYIQYTVGIYENGLLLFYDDDIFYILNRYALDHDCKEDDKIITHIYVAEIDQSLGGMIVRGLDPDTQEPIYLGPIAAQVMENEVLSGEIEGNDFIFSSLRQGLSAVQYSDNKPISSNHKKVAMVMKRNIETYKYGAEKHILDYDDLNNLYNMASHFNSVEATVKPIQLSIENSYINDFKPNKLVNLHFVDQDKDIRLGGVYHINRTTTVFIPINRSQSLEMGCSTVLLLSRRSKV